jgi:glutathione S-transferase
MKLISATPSPFARKVRIVAIEKAITLELINDVPWGPDTVVAQFNPLEQLPILIMDDGVPIYGSGFIVDWLERKFPDPALIPEEDCDFILCKKLELISNGVLDACLLYTREAGRADPDQQWLERQERKISGGVAEVGRLIANRPFAVAGRFTLADAAAGTMLASLEFGESIGLRTPAANWRRDNPPLGTYLDEISRRQSFVQTRPVMFDFKFDFAETTVAH